MCGAVGDLMVPGPLKVFFFQFFSSEFLEGRLELFFTFFVSFSGLPGGLVLAVFRKSTVFSEKVPPFFVYSTAFWLDLQGWGASKI